MRNFALTMVVLLACMTTSCSQSTDVAEAKDFQALSGPYFGQKPPGAEPQLFMPGLVSTNDRDGCVSFLDNGKLCVFGNDETGMQYTFEKDGRWTTPQHAPWAYKRGVQDNTSGGDGRRIFIQSRGLTSPDDEEKDYNIWVVEWDGAGWPEPQPLPPIVNTDKMEFYPTSSSDGSVFFFTSEYDDSRRSDIYECGFVNGEYKEAERLPYPLNTDFGELDPAVAPDGSYIIISSNRPGGYGATDHYIAFRREDGTWSHAFNLGDKFNSPNGEYRACITPDGKFFFFVSDRKTDIPKGKKVATTLINMYNDGDVYWADTTFFEDLKAKLLGTECAAEIVFEEYLTNGLDAAREKLAALSDAGEDRYHFSPSEFLDICAYQLKSGKADDANQFYQVLLKTLPDVFRINLGFALVNIWNGQAGTGLEIMEKLLDEDPRLKLNNSLYWLGYSLLQETQSEAALQVYQFNARKHPSVRSYYGLAIAYERNGEISQAIESCRKSLELNPDFEDASELLNKLEQQ